MVGTDLQHGKGARRPGTELASRHGSQREDWIDSARGENFRIFREHFLFRRDDEHLLFRRRATGRLVRAVEQAVTPGQFVRRQREFTFDLEQKDTAKFFLW